MERLKRRTPPGVHLAPKLPRGELHYRFPRRRSTTAHRSYSTYPTNTSRKMDPVEPQAMKSNLFSFETLITPLTDWHWCCCHHPFNQLSIQTQKLRERRDKFSFPKVGAEVLRVVCYDSEPPPAGPATSIHLQVHNRDRR